jgi:hypothetical protein
MALLTVTELGQAGAEQAVTMTGADVGLSDQYPNDERTWFVITNGGGVNPCVVTIAATRATADKFGFGSLDVDDITFSVPISETWHVRVPIASHGDAAGRVTVAYDQVASVTVGAFRLARH